MSSLTTSSVHSWGYSRLKLPPLRCSQVLWHQRQRDHVVSDIKVVTSARNNWGWSGVCLWKGWLQPFSGYLYFLKWLFFQPSPGKIARAFTGFFFIFFSEQTCLPKLTQEICGKAKKQTQFSEVLISVLMPSAYSYESGSVQALSADFSVCKSEVCRCYPQLPEQCKHFLQTGCRMSKFRNSFVVFNQILPRERLCEKPQDVAYSAEMWNAIVLCTRRDVHSSIYRGFR